MPPGACGGIPAVPATPTDALDPGDAGTAIVDGEKASYTERPSLITGLPINDADSCQVFDVRVDPETMICAGFDDGRTGIRSGDSGGPLVVGDVVIGITSRRTPAPRRFGAGPG